jgi:hypothetical protein
LAIGCRWKLSLGDYFVALGLVGRSVAVTRSDLHREARTRMDGMEKLESTTQDNATTLRMYVTLAFSSHKAKWQITVYQTVLAALGRGCCCCARGFVWKLFVGARSILGLSGASDGDNNNEAQAG